jgi:hypothetical protein
VCTTQLLPLGRAAATASLVPRCRAFGVPCAPPPCNAWLCCYCAAAIWSSRPRPSTHRAAKPRNLHACALLAVLHAGPSRCSPRPRLHHRMCTRGRRPLLLRCCCLLPQSSAMSLWHVSCQCRSLPMPSRPVQSAPRRAITHLGLCYSVQDVRA